MGDPHEITRLLEALRTGDPQSSERLATLVYAGLRVLARAAMRRERSGHTWQPTELVHEAFMRLLGGAQPAWGGRAQFYGIAARVMRQILVEQARARGRVKRDGGVRVPLDAQLPASAPGAVDVAALDEALVRLAALDARQARVVELRYFGGLALDEIAEALDVSVATVKRDWTFARAYLRVALDAVGDG